MEMKKIKYGEDRQWSSSYFQKLYIPGHDPICIVLNCKIEGLDYFDGCWFYNTMYNEESQSSRWRCRDLMFVLNNAIKLSKTCTTHVRTYYRFVLYDGSYGVLIRIRTEKFLDDQYEIVFEKNAKK